MRELHPTSYSRVQIEGVNEFAIKDPEKLIYKSELYYYSQLHEAMASIVNENRRIVLLSGPSASGKTTTSHKLKDRLVELGVGARVLSMDNFFRGIDQYPLLPNGTRDMETIETLDLPLINEKFQELLETGVSDFPVFDFVTQSCNRTQPIRLGKSEVLIMEGIHALNPSVLSAVDPKEIFRIYLSVRTKFVCEDQDILRPSEIRLLRRMVRDSLFRNYSPLRTVDYWDHVVASEKVNIDPYRDEVDFKMDTTLDYEVCVWHGLLNSKLQELDLSKLENHKSMNSVIEGLNMFHTLATNQIPEKSLLREFIGS